MRDETLIHELQHVIARLIGYRLHDVDFEFLRRIKVEFFGDDDADGSAVATSGDAWLRSSMGEAYDHVLSASRLCPALIAAPGDRVSRFLTERDHTVLLCPPTETSRDDIAKAGEYAVDPMFCVKVAEMTAYVLAEQTPVRMRVLLKNVRTFATKHVRLPAWGLLGESITRCIEEVVAQGVPRRHKGRHAEIQHAETARTGWKRQNPHTRLPPYARIK